MTGYLSKKDMAQDKLAQPAQEPQVCCGEYDTCLRACTPRGRHLAQPAQEPVACIHKGYLYMAHEFMSGIPDGATLLYTTPPQRKPQFKEFVEWANGAGYDTAHTYDTERSKWLCLSPMTADLWKAWQAAHNIKENT